MRKNKHQLINNQSLVVRGLFGYEKLRKFKQSRIVKAKNAVFPGYGECSRCGANWGWKKYITHDNNQGEGSFLFCKDCDKKVTVEERYEALDKRNLSSAVQCILFYLHDYHHGDMTFSEVVSRLKQGLKEFETEEFIEWPRPKEIGEKGG